MGVTLVGQLLFDPATTTTSIGSCPTLAKLGSVYADYMRRAIDAGELSPRTSTEYTKSIRRLIVIAGADCRFDALRPIDLGAIKEKLVTTCHKRRRHSIRVRSHA